MKTQPRYASKSTLWLIVIAMLAAVCLHPSASQGDDRASDADADAVQAPRNTKRYTPQGMTLNPVAIDIDPNGNIYVVEGWRHGKGAVSIVNGPMWRSGALPLDLQRTTIEQRAEHIESLIEKGVYTREFFTGQADLVRRVQDTDGDGIADKASVFAGGFNDKLDGVASGVLWHEGKLYFANVPHLWRLEDIDGDGDADKNTPGERTSMSYGYGLRWAYGGHDLHGLIKGPDGRIYFTMGDRGYNVKTQEGQRLIGLNVGSVLRMWPDGSGLEVFATGLRNPQEIAFDNYGNLFTGENNCDAGDLARFCFVPEGSDAGWRQDVQTLRHRGPWHREHIWKPRFKRDDPAQPAWIMPPLANVGRGPSGLAHYPGTGDAFPANGSFLMCDYPAGVRHVFVKPDGASFKVVDDSSFNVETQTISDLAWGYDGRLYLSDWGEGWNPNDKGHLKVMVNEAAHQAQAEVIAEVKSLFANGLGKLSDEKLIALLGHRDQRVRIEAEWEISKRDTAFSALLSELMSGKSELSRIHALWALSMTSRGAGDQNGAAIYEYFEQPDCYDHPRLHAQVLSVLGDLQYKSGIAAYQSGLQSEHPIVQHHATIALGKTGSVNEIPALLDLLERNDNDDAVLRHAASYALSLIGDEDEIVHYAMQRGAAARLGAVLALRRLNSPQLILFMDDGDLLVAAEAIRAIYDERIEVHLPALAKRLDKLPPQRMIEPVMRRVIEANVRLADAQSADRLAQLAANADAPEQWRALALEELTQWSAPRDRDGVWGWWWPRPQQTMAHANAAMQTHLPTLKQTATGQTLTQARVFELTHILKAGPDELVELASNEAEPDAVRLAGMQMLVEVDRVRAVSLAEQLLATPTSSPALRALRSMILPLDRDAAVRAYLQGLAQGTVPEQQQAIHALAVIRTPAAIDAMSELGKKLKQGTLAPQLRLDAYLTLTKYKNLPTQARAAAQQYAQRNTVPGEEPFIRDAVLAGGSIENGKDIFFTNDTAQCQRCHAVGGTGGIGPDLGAIGSLHDVQYLYTALVRPHADIAEGYTTTTVTLKNGSILTGRVLNDKSTPAQLVLANADGVEQPIPRDQIRGVPITSDQSLMPTMTDKLDPSARDVLAYLVSLKGDGAGQAGRSQGSALTGPSIVSPVKDLQHHVVLPLMLIGIFALLGLLLLVTVLGGGPTTH